MITNEMNYLKRVLGIDAVLFEQGTAVEFKICVCTPYALSTKEKLMVDKMLQSIDMKNTLYIALNSNTTEETEKIFSDKGIRFAISFGLPESNTHAAETLGVRWLKLDSISKFLDDSDEGQLKQLKKSAWQKLKAFKGEIDRHN
jgi:hypothetical protein